MVSVDDLEKLSSIEEITGSLDISVNFSDFTSLNFLRNLRTIGGVGVEELVFHCQFLNNCQQSVFCLSTSLCLLYYISFFQIGYLKVSK